MQQGVRRYTNIVGNCPVEGCGAQDVKANHYSSCHGIRASEFFRYNANKKYTAYNCKQCDHTGPYNPHEAIRHLTTDHPGCVPQGFVARNASARAGVVKASRAMRSQNVLPPDDLRVYLSTERRVAEARVELLARFQAYLTEHEEELADARSRVESLEQENAGLKHDIEQREKENKRLIGEVRSLLDENKNLRMGVIATRQNHAAYEDLHKGR